ncbi:MAG: Gfo/Idh/MocA family oxidoreductase [Planctomycetaceae bacterium]|nr:Gfo/Idh/MocA family oxidoreductase [Planctomycetaceae bacterium]
MKVGICGIGFMGMIHFLACKQVTGVEVKAICEKIPERLRGDWRKIKGNFGPQGEIMDLKGIDTYENLGDMLADPELEMIDICLPPAGHADAVIASLNAGKHVFCEKPISLFTRDADNMVQAAKASGKTLMIGHVLPFFSEYRFAWEAAQNGKFGKLLGGHFNRIISDPTWLSNFYSMDTCGGPMLDLHVHDAHFIRVMFGMPKMVHSVGRLRGNVPEYFNTQFVFDDPNLVVTATSGAIQQQGRPFTHGYEIHFEKATILFDSFMGQPLTVLNEQGEIDKPELESLGDIGAFVHEITEVTNALKKGTTSPILDGQLARDALLICHKQIEALQNKKPAFIE